MIVFGRENVDFFLCVTVVIFQSTRKVWIKSAATSVSSTFTMELVMVVMPCLAPWFLPCCWKNDWSGYLPAIGFVFIAAQTLPRMMINFEHAVFLANSIVDVCRRL